MKFKAAVLTVLVLLAAVSYAFQTVQTARTALHQARLELAKELEHQGKYDGAISVYSDLIGAGDLDHSTLASAYFGRAEMKTLLAKGNLLGDEALIEALKDYSKAIELEPKTQSYWKNRGSVYVYLGGYDEALEDFAELERLESTTRKVFWGSIRKGGLFRILGRYDDALPLFDSVIAEWAPQSLMPPNYHKALTLLKLKRFDEAIEALNEGLKGQPDYGSAFIFRSCAEAALGQFETAVRDYQHGMELVAAYPEREIGLKSVEYNEDHDRNALQYIEDLATGRAKPDELRINELCFQSWHFRYFESPRERSALLTRRMHKN